MSGDMNMMGRDNDSNKDFLIFRHDIGGYHKYVYEDIELFGFKIPKGFRTDGASIPRLFWTLLGETPYGKSLPAAVLHDYLYFIKFERKTADQLFFQCLLKCNVNRIKAFMMYAAVRLFGWLYY